MIRGVGKVRDDAGERPLLVIGLLPQDVHEMADGRQTLLFEMADMASPPMQVRVLFGVNDGEIRGKLAPLVNGRGRG